ncbi:MAG: nucleotidyltransferase domain-containing protein, partial [Peptidiphaga sp.]
MPPLGEPSRAEWTRLAEEALRQLWDAVAGGRGLPGTALAAVGSLGRGDCGPESDLDLVLLHRSHRAGDIDSLADALWYPLWDSGIELDHSVRSLDECRGIAAGDLKASISLLDLRWIAGDADLVERAARSVHADWRATARLRFPEIEALQRARVARAGELAYEIEGDVKEAAGGMRDATFVRALVASWLAERPVIDYEPSYRFLLDVRDALATVTRRHQHALRIQSHDDVAAILGFEGPAGADELLARVSGAARIIRGAYEDTAARARRNLTPSIV